MSPQLRRLVLDVLRSPIGQCVSPAVPHAKASAITLTKWHAAERAGFVRLRWLWDQHFDPSEFPDCEFGEDPEAFGVIGEYRLDPDSDEWNHADSVWGYVGYEDVLDWRENPNILDILAETLEAFRDARKHSVLAAPVPAH